MALNVSEDKICALTSDGQLLYVPLATSLSLIALTIIPEHVKVTN